VSRLKFAENEYFTRDCFRLRDKPRLARPETNRFDGQKIHSCDFMKMKRLCPRLGEHGAQMAESAEKYGRGPPSMVYFTKVISYP
jgi:hypothetical protein